MSDQPEALFLADVIENDQQSKAHHDAAAAELRRLHAEAADFHMAYRMKCDEETKAQAVEITRLQAECDALRADAERWKGLFGEALDAFNSRRPTDIEWSAMRDMAREARAALKEAK